MSMHRSILESSNIKQLSKANKPQTAVFYERAHKEVFGTSTWIRPDCYGSFNKLQKLLYTECISAREYAYDVVKLLYGWAKSKGLNFVPVAQFCGPFAMKVYKRVHESEYVRVISADEDFGALVLYGELILARYYVDANSSGKAMTIEQCLRRVGALLPREWIYAKEDGSRPIDEVVKIVAVEYGLELDGINSYKDIVRRLSC